jgi:wyosine [tRNA(Phe)-imidazoG37] synthetase (radical SAM superfamily)
VSYVFGPLPSRRLGPSLGIDPIPFKTCNWNCVYCQLGRSMPLRTERREYVEDEAVLSELTNALESQSPGSVRWVTFSGSGEPTLHAGLGRLIRGVKARTRIPVAVLTNGTLLHRPDVRDDLLAADAVLPTLDAGSETVYRRINRPAAGLTLASHIEGLEAFRRVYSGRIWVEVMLVQGINDDDASLRDIAAILERVDPDEVHVNRPVRPPAEAWVLPVDDAAVSRAVALFGRAARVIAPATAPLDLSGHTDVKEAVLGVLARHPMDIAELADALRCWSPVEVGGAVAQLAGSGRLRLVNRMGRRFWSSVEARYGERETS